MWEQILNNLILVGQAMIIFIAAYLANMFFSLYYNIKVDRQPFDKRKLAASALKALVFICGLVLLSASITTIPIFAQHVGWALPEEYIDVFNSLAIISVVLFVSVKYIKEAFDTFSNILGKGGK